MAKSISSIALYVVGITTLIFVGVITFGFYNAAVATDARDKTVSLVSVALEPSCNVQEDSARSLAQEEKRRWDSYNVRHARALEHLTAPLPCHPNNGDEKTYPDGLATFTKGLLHDANGFADPVGLALLINAGTTGTPADFDAIPQAPLAVRDFTNPQAAFAYDLIGADSHSFTVPPAPAFNSAERAADIVETYWMALTRDVPLTQYGSSALITQAIADMSTLSDYRGPPLSAQTIFRGTAPGCTTGPYISQFFYLDSPMGANSVDMRMKPPTPNRDFMADNYTEWLRVQNGEQPAESMTYLLNLPRYIFTGRDLAGWVHMDVLFQAPFTAMLQMIAANFPLKPNIPYQTTELNQMGFATFGGPQVAYAATMSAINALKAAWFQKWAVHRTLRPEVMAQRIHLVKTGALPTLPIHTDALNSAALTETFNKFGTYLLAQAFPEGSPLHPSYCAGHATVSGAAFTILKAFFDEDYVIPNPKVPDNTLGDTLVPYTGPDVLTVGHELNKAAWNVGNGRVVAGVHYRSDTTASIKLGEQVAISILRDMKPTFTEPGTYFKFRDFDGNLVVI